MQWQHAPDVQTRIKRLIKRLHLTHIDAHYVRCFRSHGSTSRARARIWSFPKVWQLALALPPHYVIEVLSEKYDRLSTDDQIRVLIHELLHIPKTFSGSLVAHKGRYHRIDARRVEGLFKQYKQSE